ncbi:MAG: PAS domain S-box protein [Vicinamibacterales bacterium]
MSSPQKGSARDADRILAAIVESAVDGIILIDSHGIVEAFNPAAERLFGYAAAEIVGQNVSSLMPSPYRDEHDGYLARYLSTGAPHIIGIGREVSGRRRDGSTFPMHLSVGELVVDGERKFAGIVHDLTERHALARQLKASEERWRSVVESAVDAIIVIDAEGCVEAFNRAAEDLFGYAVSDIVGHNVSALMPSPDRDQHEHDLRHVLATGDQKLIGVVREVRAMKKDGTTFPAQLSVGEMAIDGARKFTCIVHDLTRRVGMEEQLREQAAMARLGEMAAVVAHEVRNPLAGIRGAIQVLAGRMAPESREAAVAKQMVARIDGLNQFVNDLLVFSRPAHPRLALVDLASVIAATVEMCAADPLMAHVHLECTGSAPPVMADAELLKIVISNLVANSAHAMDRRGIVHIALGSANGCVEVVLRDSGPGIPEAVRAKLFTPFYTTKSRGTGLGLSTAKRLVEAHHGSIELTCPLEGGTTITLRFPVALS